MRIAAVYSFKHGKEIVETNFAAELAEVEKIIRAIEALQYRTKTSKDKDNAWETAL